MKKLKLAALLAAVMVGIGLHQFLKELQTPREAPHTTVVVAAVDIPENTRITEEMVTLKSISNDSLLDQYMLEIDSVIGMAMTSDVYAGEQIRRNRLVGVSEENAAKTLAYNLTPGMRAISVFVDLDTGLVNFLKPGNRVDLLAYYTHAETRPSPTNEQELEQVQVPTTQMLTQNVLVLAVGTTMDKAGLAEYTTVTLEVTPQEAMHIAAVNSWGKLRLLLRSPLDEERVPLDLVIPETIYEAGAGA